MTRNNILYAHLTIRDAVMLFFYISYIKRLWEIQDSEQNRLLSIGFFLFLLLTYFVAIYIVGSIQNKRFPEDFSTDGVSPPSKVWYRYLYLAVLIGLSLPIVRISQGEEFSFIGYNVPSGAMSPVLTYILLVSPLVLFRIVISSRYLIHVHERVGKFHLTVTAYLIFLGVVAVTHGLNILYGGENPWSVYLLLIALYISPVGTDRLDRITLSRRELIYFSIESISLFYANLFYLVYLFAINVTTLWENLMVYSTVFYVLSSYDNLTIYHSTSLYHEYLRISDSEK